MASLSYSIKSNFKLWLFCGNQRGNLLTGNQIKQTVRGKVRAKNSPLKCELDDNKIATRISQPNKNNGKITVLFYELYNLQSNDNVTKTVTKIVTETVTKLLKTEQANLYRSSKIFTKAIKVFAEFSESIKKGKALAKANNYLLSFFANFSRQALITQAEKLLLSFLTFASICSISSWGKRIPLVSELLFLYPVAIICNLFQALVFRHYTTNNKDKKALTYLCTLHYSVYAPNDCLGGVCNIFCVSCFFINNQ